MRQHGSWLVWDLVITYQLHWLPIAQRIEYKICLLVHKSFVGHVPDYIIDLLTPAASDPSGHHGHHYDRQAAAISS